MFAGIDLAKTNQSRGIGSRKSLELAFPSPSHPGLVGGKALEIYPKKGISKVEKKAWFYTAVLKIAISTTTELKASYCVQTCW